MERVEHLIIGAGATGRTLAWLLREEGRVVLVDPRIVQAPAPTTCVVPSTFDHPALASLIAAARARPSHSPCRGELFTDRGAAVFVRHDPERAMHLSETDLVRVMREAWIADVREAGVTEIELRAGDEPTVVRTTAAEYEVGGLVLDTSDALTLASALGHVETTGAWHRAWAEYEVRGPSLQWTHQWTGGAERPGVERLAHATWHHRVDDATWRSETPSHDGARVTVTVSSRHDPVDASRVDRIVMDYRVRSIRPTPIGPLARSVHPIRRARTAAAPGAIFLGPGLASESPVASVWSSDGITQAIEVALRVAGGWSADLAAAHTRCSARAWERRSEAWREWWTGELPTDLADAVAATMELGSLEPHRDPYEPLGPDTREEAAHLLGLRRASDGSHECEGWTLREVRRSVGGVTLRWSGHGLPPLIILVVHDPDGDTRSFTRRGELAMSYKPPDDGHYPVGPRVVALFAELGERIEAHPQRWWGLASE